MKIGKRTITVKLGDPGDEATLTFDEMRENTRAKVMALLNKAKEATDALLAEELLSTYRATILGLCVSVENLTEDGKPVTVDDVRSASLYSGVNTAIIEAYLRGAKGEQTPEAEEKNDSTPDSSAG